MCGRLVLARELGEDSSTWGLAHAWCHDRACPHCMATLQRTRAASLRDFVAPHIRSSLFVTLTQPKRSIDDEGPGQAADRVLGRDREGVETGHGYRALWRGASGRFLRLFFCGGLRALEVVLSSAGTERRDGSKVEITGWHAHIHALLQVTAPSSEACLQAAKWVRRRLRTLDGDEREVAIAESIRLQSIARSLKKLGPRIEAGEGLANEWRELASRVVLSRWLAVCEGADAPAQDVQPADGDRVGQVTKYLTKPFELRDPRRARELFVALESRKAIKAWGTWRSWAKDADEEDDEDDAKLEVSCTPVRALFAVLDSDADGFFGETVVVDFRTYEVAASARRVMDDVAKVGRTFSARDRQHAFDGDDARLREATRRRAGELRLNALGLFDASVPRDTWIPPPYPIRDLLEKRALEVEDLYRQHIKASAEVAAQRSDVRRDLQRAGVDASEAAVELELVARHSAEWTADAPRRTLEDRLAALERQLAAEVLFGDRDELDEERRRLALEVDEVQAIRASKTRDRFTDGELLDCWIALSDRAAE
jgi:hypothetical protein